MARQNRQGALLCAICGGLLSYIILHLIIICGGAVWFLYGALMAVRSKALPLTASCLSLTTVRVRIPPGACEKVASDLGLDGCFRRVLRFPPPVTTG